MNQYLIKQKMHLKQKSVSMIAAVELAIKTEQDGPLILGPMDRAELNQVVQGIKFLIAEQSLFIDYLCERTGEVYANVIQAIRDNNLNDGEKVEVLNAIICSFMDNLPDEWKNFYNLKLKRIAADKEWEKRQANKPPQFRV